MPEPDPVAVALGSALTPALAEAAAEVEAWTRAMAAKTVNGWDFTSVGPAPDFPRLRLRSLRALVQHAYATGEPCDGERCEDGGAAHCHRCAEVDADNLLAERDRLRAENELLLAILRSHQPDACSRSTAHPPHDWMRSRHAAHCPGLGAHGEPPAPVDLLAPNAALLAEVRQLRRDLARARSGRDSRQEPAAAREAAERTLDGESGEP